MIKAILVLSDDTLGFEAALACAIDIARQFAAHLDVLHIRPDPTNLVPVVAEEISAATIELREAAERAIEDRTSTTKAVFEHFLAATDVPASWQVATGLVSEIAAGAARLSDLAIIGRPEDSGDPSWRATMNSVLFNSGRPVLLLPRKLPPFFGERVVVAWNGSLQAVHAVAAALPLLRLAKRTTVLSAGSTDPYASPARLVTYLARHDIPAAAGEFESGSVTVGQALLEQSRRLHANLLVMGAYGHSRVREMILGGATWEILAAADIPVLMAH